MTELVSNVGNVGEIILLESNEADIKVEIRSKMYYANMATLTFSNCKRVSLIGNLLVITMDFTNDFDKHFAMPIEKVDGFYYG